MSTELVLLRHGQTEWNLTHRIQGSVDIPLNAMGLAQARAARDALMNAEFDLVFSSHLERAIVTAELVNAPHNKPHGLDERLAERAHGRYEGWTVQAISEEVGMEAIDEFFQHSPELESWETVTERVMSALRDIAEACAGGTGLVVSHGGAIKAAVAAIRGVHHRTMPGLFNCSLTRITVDGTWAVTDYNGVAHLSDAIRT